MKVSELIAELAKMDPNAVVIINGHSDGDDYNEATDINEFNVSKYEKHRWSGDLFISNQSENSIRAIFIN